MTLYIIISVVSLAGLLFASDWFIDAAEKIGLSLGISPFIVGVTIVAFGTSLPELATSIASVYSGDSEIVTGNVVGSNIANILLVLGLTAFFGSSEIKLDFNIWQIDMPLLIGSAVLMYIAVWDNSFSMLEAIIFLVALAAFLMNSMKGSEEESLPKTKIRTVDIIKLIVGGIAVFIGAKYTIFGIQKIAELTEIAPEFFSLTFIALGTSLPEIVVSIAAGRRGKHAIAVGNVLGSNIFNTYAVMSLPSFLGELKITDEITNLGIPFMLLATVLFGAVTIANKITKWEGMLLLLVYVFYIAELYKTI